MDHLIGQKLPDVILASGNSTLINPAQLAGLSVIFCYPYTGRPGHADPVGWDDIPGAHGSTPQALGFSKRYEEFERLDLKVFGLSFQDAEWQNEFVERTALRVPLLSDNERIFSTALALPTFRAGENDYLRRITILSRGDTIFGVRYPVKVPENDANETLALLRRSANP